MHAIVKFTCLVRRQGLVRSHHHNHPKTAKNMFITLIEIGRIHSQTYYLFIIAPQTKSNMIFYAKNNILIIEFYSILMDSCPGGIQIFAFQLIRKFDLSKMKMIRESKTEKYQKEKKGKRCDLRERFIK